MDRDEIGAGERFLTAFEVCAVYLNRPIKSLDASGGSVFHNWLGAAKGALIRAAASSQPLAAHRSQTENSVTLWLPTFLTIVPINIVGAMKLVVYLGFLLLGILSLRGKRWAY